jgi:protein disulfide-isomerase
MAISDETKKPLLLFFWCDWCGWCIRCKRGFKTPEFATWAKVVLVELDYPRRAPQTPEIKSKMKNCKWLLEFKGFNHYINATTKEGKLILKALEVPVM